MMAKRFSSGVHLGRDGIRLNPAFRAATQTITSCTTPAITEPMAKAVPCAPPLMSSGRIEKLGKTVPDRNSAAIKMMFKNTGAAAAAAKRPDAFRTPDTKAASEMNRIYGNTTRPSVTVMSNLTSPTNPEAMARTSQGIKSVATAVRINKIVVSPAKASRANASASSPASSFFENSGMKAMLNAPSPKNRRNMLGRAKAIRKASATGPVPSQAAIIMSRTNPRMRLIIVQPPTTNAPDISLIWRTISRKPWR